MVHGRFESTNEVKNKMEKRINKKLGIIIGTMGLLVMSLFFVSAFGVSTSYWDGNPLKLAPGESMIVTLGLQNKVGSENVTLRANLTNDGDGIATFVDENLDYFVLLGGGAGVPIKIEIPEDEKIPGVHQITLSFTQISSGDGGMVRLVGGFAAKFPVEIVVEGESELYVPKLERDFWNKKTFNWAVLIILTAIVLFLLKRKGKLDFLFGKKASSF